jgi:putative NIF3 family GTP cyclohydrolase 1 type 2
MSVPHSPLTAAEVARLIESEMPPRKPGTLDTFKSGDESAIVRGIATTFMATLPVLRQAVEAGANLVITHEPSYYNHLDETAWLENDPVYAAKRKFLDEHGLIVWRFHDGWHLVRPDGILLGEERRLGWAEWKVAGEERVYRLPEQTVKSLATHCKKSVGADWVRVAGNPEALCRTVGLLPGAVGGRAQIQMLMRPEVDAIVCGESPEWETCEYVRDATAAGLNKAMIVLGHANSEEAGMAYFAEWLQKRVPAHLPVTHLVAGDPFRFV